MHPVDLEQLAAYFRSCSDVAFAVVFGSAQDGHVRAGGDLDIGVLFDTKPSPARRITVMTQAAEAAGFDVLDLVDLHDADPILAFEAVSGRYLCRNEPASTAAFVSLVSREYEDVMQRLNRAA